MCVCVCGHIFALPAMDLGFRPVSVPFLLCVDLLQNCVCQGWRESQNLRVDIILHIGVHIFEVNRYVAPHNENPTFMAHTKYPHSLFLPHVQNQETSGTEQEYQGEGGEGDGGEEDEKSERGGGEEEDGDSEQGGGGDE